MTLGWIDIAVTLLTVLTASLLKKWDGYNTKFIPLANFALAAAIRLLAALGVGTVEAATSDVTMAGVLVAGINWGSFARLVLHAVVNALISTGAHSAPKNVLQGLRRTPKAA